MADTASGRGSDVAPEYMSVDEFTAFIREHLALAPSEVQMDSPIGALPARVQKRMSELTEQVFCLPTTGMVWDHMLIEAERDRLSGGDRTAAINAYRYGHNMLICVRRYWIARAVLEIAYAVQGMSRAEYASLQSQLLAVDPVQAYLQQKHASDQAEADEIDYRADVEAAYRTKALVLIDTERYRKLYWQHQLVHGD